MTSHRDWVMVEFKRFVKDNNLTSGKLLDVGCYNTALQKQITELGFEWVGVDRAPAEEGISLGVMEQLPFADNSFDIVFCCHAFEHSEHPIEALKEFKRVTKKWIYIATPFPCKHQILEADSDHIFVLNPMQMERLFRYAGYKGGQNYVQWKDISLEQDYNIISIGVKE